MPSASFKIVYQDYKYDIDMIEYMYLKGFQNAKLILKDGGHFLVKTMDFDQNQ